MTVALAILMLFAAGGLVVLGSLVWRPVRRAARRRGFVVVHPQHRAWLRSLRLVEPDDFLALSTVVVSGHPGRNVGRAVLGAGMQSRLVYLKREENVRWTTRLANMLSGFGWVSRPVREAQMLEALERDDLPGPRWLATGEDGGGRAFLLVEAVSDAVPLSLALQGLSGAGRQRLLRHLGQTLARLHGAGFFHRDLYAKHVLVNPHDGSVCLLDWQRAWRGAWIPRAARVRDLAALHATLADSLAGPRDRVGFLRAYLGGRCRGLRGLVAGVEAAARHLRQRRHIREKRQVPTGDQQAWVCLDGQALCVTPGLAGRLNNETPDWLRLDRQVLPTGQPAVRRWVVLPGGRALLVCRQAPIAAWQRCKSWLTGKPVIAPEQRQATLLWRLEKHGVPAPRVLAVGARQRINRQDSFVLVEPFADTVRLGVWLMRYPSGQRGELLRRTGTLLARLHEACCYLNQKTIETLAVRHGPEGVEVVLEDVARVEVSRKPRPERAGRDLHCLREALSRLGCAERDWQQVAEGYAAHEPARVEIRAVGFAQTHQPAEAEAPGGGPVSLWRRLRQICRRLHQRPDWEAFAGPGWADRIMDVAVTDRFHAKQGRSTGRWVLHGPEGRRLVVYLKRHHALPFWQGWLAALWPGGNWSPAMQEYAHLEWARQQGVPVPATVAAGEFLGPWGRLRSFLAVEELTDMLPLHEAIPEAQRRLDADTFRQWKRGLVAELARLARLLHDRRHFHKDLYLCHFFIHQEDLGRIPPSGWRGCVWLIDLHRLSHHPWTWWLWLLKDLAQLMYSSEVSGVDVRDQITFWKHYRGPGPRRSASRWLRQLVVFKWQRYRRHNLRRKQRMRDE